MKACITLSTSKLSSSSHHPPPPRRPSAEFTGSKSGSTNPLASFLFFFPYFFPPTYVPVCATMLPGGDTRTNHISWITLYGVRSTGMAWSKIIMGTMITNNEVMILLIVRKLYDYSVLLGTSEKSEASKYLRCIKKKSEKTYVCIINSSSRVARA